MGRNRVLYGIVVLLFSLNLCGCIFLAAGAAAGGTAVWLSGKLTESVNTPFDRTVRACRSGLESLRLPITKETITQEKAQILSKYTDGRTIWVDIHRTTQAASQIQVRIGAKSDKQAAQKVLDAIKRYL